MLAAKTTPSRTVLSLDGVWDFKLDQDDEGISLGWNSADLYAPRPMPVPSSFNDISVDLEIHRHVGPVWYQRQFVVPASFEGQRIFLRFEGVTHDAVIFLDDEYLDEHVGGFLPFELDVTDQVTPGSTHRLSVRVDNRPQWGDTLPGGVTTTYGDDYLQSVVNYEHFDYCGINRSVLLCSRPQVFVEDVTFKTVNLFPLAVGGFESAACTYEITLDDDADADDVETTVSLINVLGKTVATATGLSGELIVQDPKLWSPKEPYLYTLKIEAGDDVYEMPVGVRTVMVLENQLMLNGEPVQLQGFSLQEDSAIRGRGHDDVMTVHDMELMRWMGANCLMPKGYALDASVLELADKLGLLVIESAPAYGFDRRLRLDTVPVEEDEEAGTLTISAALVKEAISHTVRRDKNHPCVVGWSVAYEPATNHPEDCETLKKLISFAREADPAHRPVSFVASKLTNTDENGVLSACDMLLLNRTYGWDKGTGDLLENAMLLDIELVALEVLFNKPIVMTSFGADAFAGNRSVYEDAWSEDYQVSLMANLTAIIDRHPCVIGELAGSLCDYPTRETNLRPGGSHLGLFTRERQPKSAAFTMRARWRLRAGKSL